MRRWNNLVIEVNYHPCDPGINNWFCERTDYPRIVLEAGRVLSFKDPGGLFEGIRVDSLTEDGVVLEYGGRKYSLNRRRPDFLLDRDGRDYTEFRLDVFLEFDLAAEDDPDEPEPDDEEPDYDDEPEDDDGRWDAYV